VSRLLYADTGGFIAFVYERGHSHASSLLTCEPYALTATVSSQANP
jgi:hypothetical protein